MLAVLALAGFGASTAHAQSAVVTVTSPSAKVLVNAQMRLSAAITDIAGTPLVSSGLAWTTSDSTVASISADGMVRGLFPGDVSVSATDPNTGAAGSTLLHVAPGSISIQVSPAVFHVGESAKLAATAFDAAGTSIAGVTFQFRSGEPAVASMASDGSLSGVGEGFATVEARIPSVTSDPALVATTQIQVLPKPAYKIERLISTDVTTNSTIAAYTAVSADAASEAGAIVTLANGNQAAVLIENGHAMPLAVVGQALPNAGRMVVRIDAVSANAKGDVALLIEYPSQWCQATVILFPHGKPEQEIGLANCNNGMYARSLSDDGHVLYRNNDQIYSASLTDIPQLLFSIAAQPPASDPVRNVNDFAPSRVGTFVLNTYLTSGTHAYLYFDGKTLTQAYKDGDQIIGPVWQFTNNTDMPIAGPDGTFYARVNGSGFTSLVQFAPGPLKRLIGSADVIPGGKVGWIQNVTDAGGGGVLVVADFNTASYHTSIAAWTGSALVEYTPVVGWASMISGAILPNGTALVSAVLPGDAASPSLRTVTSGGVVSVALDSGIAFPQPVPAGVDWHYASRGGSGAAIPFRGAGDAILNVGASVSTLAAVGITLPNSQKAVSIGAAIANQSGDLVFSAQYPTGSAIFRYRGGKLDTLIDTAVAHTGPQGRSLNYANNYRGRYLAMNDRGDVAAASGYTLNNVGEFDVVMFGSDGPHLVAQQNTPAPGGGNYTGMNTVAIDNNGHVLFIAQTSDGRTAVYYWDGSAVTRVIGIGDAGPSGFTVNEVSNIAGGGNGFLILLAFGSYQVRELRYFDGSKMTTLQSTDASMFDGTRPSYYWENEVTLAANGDAHVMAVTQDSLTGVYAHNAGGKDLVGARSRDPLPGGEWLIMPLSVSSTSTGQIYFTADVLLNGVETLALYRATPQ
jgi:hypothetical protein